MDYRAFVGWGVRRQPASAAELRSYFCSWGLLADAPTPSVKAGGILSGICNTILATLEEYITIMFGR